MKLLQHLRVGDVNAATDEIDQLLRGLGIAFVATGLLSIGFMMFAGIQL